MRAIIALAERETPERTMPVLDRPKLRSSLVPLA
jgi:hypothetical protein